MDVKLQKVVNSDGSQHGWMFRCPDCDDDPLDSGLHCPTVGWSFIPERIIQHFDGMTVTTGDVAKAFEIPLTTASASLRRLAERGAAQRVKLGHWHVARTTHRVGEESGR